jgi:hypothetical protein
MAATQILEMKGLSREMERIWVAIVPGDCKSKCVVLFKLVRSGTNREREPNAQRLGRVIGKAMQLICSQPW